MKLFFFQTTLNHRSSSSTDKWDLDSGPYFPVFQNEVNFLTVKDKLVPPLKIMAFLEPWVAGQPLGLEPQWYTQLLGV